MQNITPGTAQKQSDYLFSQFVISVNHSLIIIMQYG